MNDLKLLNIGCGKVFHLAWVNLDLVPIAPHIKPWDIRNKLPFADRKLDVCYSSHVIEHFSPLDAKRLLVECFRILRPQGILRVVVPDLEQIARLYLYYLERAVPQELEMIQNYDWMMLELYDQSVRSYSGGRMGDFLSQSFMYNESFVRERIGLEIDNYFSKKILVNQQTFLDRFKSQNPSQLLKKIRYLIAQKLVLLLAGSAAVQAFEEGIFRQSGEIHKWMYDRFSLYRLLEETGFIEIKVCRADESRIPNFNDYELDMSEGQIRKPDSLYMEAIKP